MSLRFRYQPFPGNSSMRSFSVGSTNWNCGSTTCIRERDRACPSEKSKSRVGDIVPVPAEVSYAGPNDERLDVCGSRRASGRVAGAERFIDERALDGRQDVARNQAGSIAV